ncbi:MAG: hypothetical protein R3E39_14575 [Anaerolineae bacterium]
MTLVYRLQQGFRALFAFSQPVDLELAATYLSPRLLELFEDMQRDEQLHSLNVLRTVLTQGTAPVDLTVAALLHDVGKVCYPIVVWQKTLAVLVRRLWPQLYVRWSQGNPANLWQRPFVVYECHPAWGADMVAKAGGSEATQWLITHHADVCENWIAHPNYEMLKRLQAADDAN